MPWGNSNNLIRHQVPRRFVSNNFKRFLEISLLMVRLFAITDSTKTASFRENSAETSCSQTHTFTHAHVRPLLGYCGSAAHIESQVTQAEEGETAFAEATPHELPSPALFVELGCGNPHRAALSVIYLLGWTWRGELELPKQQV